MNQLTTIIGAGCAVNGNIAGDEDLTIEGQVEGTISLSKTVTIEASGVVHADLQVESAVICGVLVGNVTATHSVQLREGGRVVGDIRAPQVSLAEGVAFSGRIDMGEIDLTAERPAPRPAAGQPMAPMGRAPAPGGTMPPRLPSLDSPFAGTPSMESRFAGAPSTGPMSSPAPSPERGFSRPPVTGTLPPRTAAPMGGGTVPPDNAGSGMSRPAPPQVKPSGAPVPRMRAIGRMKAKKKG